MKKTSTAPKHLSAEAKKWWTDIQDEYGIADSGGLLLLQTAMEAFDRMREAQKSIKKHGAVYTDRFDQIKNNPACTVERDCRKQVMAALKDLNLDLEPLRDKPGRPPGV